jgi:hypothetical protein
MTYGGLVLFRFLMRHDPDPARVMNVLLSWSKDPKTHDAATIIQRRTRGFLTRASVERQRRSVVHLKSSSVVHLAMRPWPRYLT